ncbi:MAG: rRNA pseudouridine synthase [Ignavibacteriaceae bacterium]|nr:rRNA pseudouridine synthase [Ignavibacteriaceae bacterium]
MRLNKFISECGIASRRKAEELILQGRIEVNGKLIIELAFSVDTSKDTVTFDGEKIKPKEHVYFLLNKPSGVVTTTNDEKKRRTVVELIKTKSKIFPIGRLDYNTTGVLLLTNDGDFANFILHPSRQIPREYEVRIDKPLSLEDEKTLLKGVYLEDGKGKFVSVKYGSSSRKFVIVESFEGRNHFIKNMFKKINYTVEKLHRSRFGIFNVRDLIPGAYLQLSEKDIKNVYEKYKY